MSQPTEFQAIEDIKRAIEKSAAENKPLLDPSQLIIPEVPPRQMSGSVVHVYSGKLPASPNVPPDQSRLIMSHLIVVRARPVEPWWLRWWRAIVG